MTHSSSRIIQHFLRSIAKDIRLYQELLVTLQRQKKLYFSFESQYLEKNIQEQVILLNRLNQSAKERKEWMSSIGVPLNEQGVSKIFDALPPTIATPARKQWAVLHALIKQCKSENISNGTTAAAFQEIAAQFFHPAAHTYEEQTF
ncbi:flagellar export chaperone FlgN [Vibrio sagamiensis]|uniref:Flagellar protein FlgN n=1 Tax=Vibrio sagamiensis NBRC 104589 TaxID=1219064 RepID=A0A511QD53_9VIBR|nr:flagellar export chaperone FlgN [Vibrio sagamiensis]PNQ66938.1 hypothetical protein C1141_08335 [Vibrio agarivorans]GEM75231.1 hypothetical protein VSA01S_13430 [Vibrio sagamiensis NBRC 104589]